MIRDEIFKLLQSKSNIIFFPLDEELDLDGFHIERCVNRQMKAFVYINTAKNFKKISSVRLMNWGIFMR